ncbi:tetratricopeptide repeat protein [Streptomyces sp. NBS 14/10]|uniref:tetratricopeptide repeat protein n=1 Tax=Streptomyces sp. NBS 14/10 TaxID=1945643 RepID=UPI0015C5A089|nr:tetratricopeptide repeat protein [Streptomyces sp. NBS 14/10]KAK1178055.1 tetratricopeptide repeat protein [Streptomyces sp. NBS 14/10]
MQAATIHGGVFIGADAARRSRSVPRQLPQAPRHFTDRTDNLAALDHLLEPAAPSLAVVTGPAGVGKTSLALRWLHKHRDNWPDGQLYVDLRGHLSEDPVSPSTVLSQFLRALGVSTGEIPAELAEQAALYRTVIADQRIAVLCDNALSAAQVRPLRPASEAAVCLVTSRWHLSSLLLDGAALVPLAPLDTDSAVELLGQIAGQDRIAGDRMAARNMVTAGGCFPLSVAVGAALLLTRPEWTLASVAARLTAIHSAGPDEEVSMNASLDHSYAALPEAAASLYRRLGLHPGTVLSKQVAQAVAATAPAVDDVDGCLAALVDANLLTAPDPERFRFHDVIHQHARGRAESDETGEQRLESVQRIIDSYLSCANAADQVLYPQRRRPPVEYAYAVSAHPDFPDGAAALAWFDRERENLLAAQRLAAQSGIDGATWQLADAMWALFIYLRYHDDWISTHELGVAGAARCGHRLAESRMRTGLGIALRDAGRPGDALRAFTAALALRREIGDRRGEGLVLHNIGITHRRMGDWDTARSVLKSALSVREESGDSRGVARVHGTLGEVDSLVGQHESALAHLTRAREALSNTQDPYEALTERLLGEAHLRSGDLRAAHTHLAAALEVLRHTGEVFETGAIHEAFGVLAEREHDTASARTHYARAEAVYTRLSAGRDAHRIAKRLRHLDSAIGE